MTLGAILPAALACTMLSLVASAVAGDDAFPPTFPAARASGTQGDARVPAGMRAELKADGTWRVTFALSITGAAGAQKASVAGDFTGWQGQAVAMTRAADGSFAAVIDVPPGTHRYKLILDGTRWITDPSNPRNVDDGNGGKNSIIDLGPEVALDPSLAHRGDGAVEGAAFRHNPNLPADREQVASEWHVRARTLRGDVEQVDMYWKSAAATGRLAMTPVGTRGPFDIWDSVLPLTGKHTIAYTFVAKDGQLSVSDPNIYSLDTASSSPFRTPAWAKDAVWYQVMVDRFRNGDASNDPNGTIPWKHDWYKPVGAEGNDGQTFYKHFVFGRFGGGDLAGLRSQLPYLRSLGVNALYLMPMFQASTPHKYNTTNYIHVDEHFGTKGDYAPAAAKEDILDVATWSFTPTDKAFLDFIREAKGLGFRVIIDGVFNHCGTDHPAFQDVKRNGKDSKFANWFDITSWDPFKYAAWWGFSELPVFRKDPEHGLAAESIRKHLFEITRRWMDPDGDGDPSDGVDGWRLDVPNEVPLPFWHEWCKHVRSINPDAYISGEIWERADRWLDGEAFDAVMNYEFAKPLVRWVIDRTNKITPTALDGALAELRLAYPAECTYAMMNLLDSHDTDRVSSMAKNPDRVYNQKNREQEGDAYDASKPTAADYAKQRLMALVQMTYVGAPMIYFGDEVGMWGSNDPNNRKPMVWEDLGAYEDPQQTVDSALLNYYRTIIALRAAHPALRTGTFRTVLTDDAQDVWAFVRSGHGEELLVALNASDRPATVSFAALGEGWQDAYGTPGFADNGLTSTTIPAVGGRVWHRRIK
ncbi:MAG: alpha-amylase family glycosyl hydrolase [Planctomycetota bacterium]|nr:alpha-amylase family glycosyl hydrolase [Planctomycetota bacterium]